ncbi:MAG: hypothetical protein WDO18_04200 [Acidobacteriota bacterium]
MVRSFTNVVGAEVGVHTPEKVLLGWTSVPRDKYATPESRLAYFDLLRSRLRALPGVESVSLATTFPVNNPVSYPFEVDGMAADKVAAVGVIASGPEYFRTAGGGDPRRARFR